MMKRFLRLRYFFLVTSLTFSLTGCNESNSTPPVSDQSFGDLLITQRNSANPEMWTCLGENGLVYGYTFYDRGAVEGIDAYIGIGIVALDDVDQFNYIWSVEEDFSALYLDSPPTDSRDVWTDIVFTSDKKMRATSGSVGVLDCSKESGEPS